MTENEKNKIRKALNLEKGDNIMSCWCETTRWAKPMYFLIQGRDGKLRTECLQLGERPMVCETMFNTLEEAHKVALGSVKEVQYYD